MNNLITIVGATGTGKSSLGIHLAKSFNGEIVNADSRQIYRHMDIGTGKPSPKDLAEVRHHLFSVVNPDDDFNITYYLALAKKAIDDIQSRNHIPILVGGTGQYIWGLLEDWQIPHVPPQAKLRADLLKQAEALGSSSLWEDLNAIDHESAILISPNNTRRLVRAIEVCKYTSRPFSQLRKKGKANYTNLIIGLSLPRKELYDKIDRRVDEMIRNGWKNETVRLLQMGYDTTLASMTSVGYKEMELLCKQIKSQSETMEAIKKRTHRYARRQSNWFSQADQRIDWVSADMHAIKNSEDRVTEFLNANQLN